MSETALAVILLVGSALLIRSFVALYRLDRGFETKNVVTMQTSLGGARYFEGESHDKHNSQRTGPRSFGSGRSGGGCYLLCAAARGYGLPFEIVGRQSPATLDVGGVWSIISPGFFDVFKIPVKRRRAFTDRDDAKAPPVAVINERMAREYWMGRDPLLDQIVIGRGFTMKEFKDEPPRRIIGIVGDVRNAGINPDPTRDLLMYVPQAHLTDAENAFLARNASMAWVIRTQAEPHVLVPAIQE